MDVQYNVILIRYGELALKQKKTRLHFELILVNNITQALKAANISHRIVREWGRIYVYSNELDRCVPVIQRIFGVVSLSQALQTKGSIPELIPVITDFARHYVTSGDSFALRVTRSGTHEFSSQDVAIELGNVVVHSTGATVDLTDPTVEIHVEIRDEKSFVFTEILAGVGGLPLGTQGNVLGLINTKFSLLAAWYLMKRGCKVVFVVTDEINIDAVQDFAAKWYAETSIHVLHSPKESMMNNLKRLAEQYRCDALVLGLSLHQKKGQDLTQVQKFKNSISLPVLLPLIAMTDDEIKKNCVEIGVL
jgi:thiamine biosynthesis protein ThiI